METALKQRLVGAMVLVALAVIFLPMLIKGPAPESGVWRSRSRPAAEVRETGHLAPTAFGRDPLQHFALTVAGLVSFPKLGVLDRPDIEFPAVVVTIARPKAMASSRADCVFGEARLISSARMMLAKIGPGRNSNSSWLRL